VALAGSGNTRTATCSTSTLTVGTHSITAAYAGDAGNLASTSAVLSQVVNPAAGATSTIVATSLTPSIVGTSVTFTASVTGSAPTGTVNFKDGATSIAGCAAVALAGSGNTAPPPVPRRRAGTMHHALQWWPSPRPAPVSQVVDPAAGCPPTALHHGGVATASSTYPGLVTV
jgi:hypothetical protein